MIQSQTSRTPMPRATLTVLAASLVLGACTSQGPARNDGQAASSPDGVVVGTVADSTVTDSAQAPPQAAMAASAQDNAVVVAAADAGAPVVVADADANAPTDAELDAQAIYGTQVYDPVADPTLPPSATMAVAYDPWEGWNRRVHGFNNAVDRTVAKPLAKAYVRVVPRPVRLGVTNFFSNLGQPVSALNALLQGKPKQAGQSLARFLVNTTLGIGGIFDPASDANLPRRSEDFGQTLGVWGWTTSRFVELPLFGPRTLRDTFGLIGDAPLSPVRQVDDSTVRIGLQGLQLVDVRTQLFAVDSLREGAVDEYALVRDAWLQRRNYQIQGDRKQSDESLPDYLLDDDANPTVPVDVMPVVPLSSSP
ncbi:MlaA family lipoprotein [Luteimonas sp. RIT-PG2_3]